MLHAGVLVAVVTRITVAALVVVAAGAVGVDVSSAARIEVTAVPTRVAHARAPVGRAGDVELVRWSLRDRYGRTVGTAVFDCRWFGPFDRLCYGEVRMPKGRIAVVGSSETRELGAFSVVGGTGLYDEADGTLEFVATGLRRLTVVVNV